LLRRNRGSKVNRLDLGFFEAPELMGRVLRVMREKGCTGTGPVSQR
jgi:acetolactate synthase regulatory subunit